MTTNSAPIYTFGSFNASFFPNSYLDYPIAQGQETIQKLLTTNIDTISSGSTINLCNSMTTGTLNIGTNTARTGTINIGNGAGAIGAIDIGSSTTTITVEGLLSASLGLTTDGAITLPTTSYTPSLSQLGLTTATVSNSTAITISPANTPVNVLTISSIPIGVYIVVFTVRVDTQSDPAAYQVASASATNGILTMTLPPMASSGGSAGSNATGGSYTGFFRSTSSAGRIVFSVQSRTGTSNVGIGNTTFTSIRIA